MFILKYKIVFIAVLLLVMAVIGRWWQGEYLSRKGTTIPAITVSETLPKFVVVQIDGAVKTPGIYRITSDAHVMELVFLAGGLLPEARLGKINLAKVLEDGDRIHILGAIKVRKKLSKKTRGSIL
jgi:competence protein ComEA